MINTGFQVKTSDRDKVKQALIDDDEVHNLLNSYMDRGIGCTRLVHKIFEKIDECERKLIERKGLK